MINTFIPMRDWKRISPYNINKLSSRKVTRGYNLSIHWVKYFDLNKSWRKCVTDTQCRDLREVNLNSSLILKPSLETLSLPWVTKTELLLTISIQYQPDKLYYKNCMVDSKEIYKFGLGVKDLTPLCLKVWLYSHDLIPFSSYPYTPWHQHVYSLYCCL